MKTEPTIEKFMLRKFFEQLSAAGGSFQVASRSGATEYYGSGASPQFTIRFNDDNVPGFIGGGDLLTSFGEAYMDGRVDVEGDLADLISLALKSGLMSVTQNSHGFAGAALRAVGKLRSLKTEKENIRRHYDLGNDFFRLWLDESMTYSCAYFRNASDTLEEAQQQKIDHSLKKLRLQPDETLLDIGCGWGALMMRAAERYNVNVTGITLSEEQFAYANRAIEERDLMDRAGVRLADYGALSEEEKRFDKIVSIGMIEHVSKDNLAVFFQTVENLLKPNGLALLHLITGAKEGPINHWVEKYIFPGGYIPTLPETIAHLATHRFSVWDVENLDAHYRLTLDHWSERFERVAAQVREKFDERFVQMWRLYLRASSAAFREGAVEVHQILASAGRPADLPLTREDVYER